MFLINMLVGLFFRTQRYVFLYSQQKEKIYFFLYLKIFMKPMLQILIQECKALLERRKIREIVCAFRFY